MTPAAIIDVILVISLAVFGFRLFVKESKAVLGDLFQMLEFTLRWWIHIRNIVKNPLTAAPLVDEAPAA